jgi:hypothetical protein
MRLDVNKEARDRADDEIRRVTRAIQTEENRAKNKSAFQEEADRLAEWDPYDQNASSPFFDPEWMFGFKGGFDIVIGNPPYVRQEDIKEQKPALQAYGYVCFDGVADLFVYFYERGAKLLSDGGHLCYITSNKYFRAGYGEKLRAYLSAETRLLTLIDFGDAPVFDAIAYPSIILAQRASPAPSHELNAFTWTPGPDISEFPVLFREHAFHVPQSGLRADGWQLERPDVLALLDKLRAAGTPLGEYVHGKFYRGILTGLNEAFVVDRATRDRLIAEHPSSAEILKPFLRGRDVKRWRCQFAEKYLIKIESSENKKHPWSGKPAAKAETVFKQEYPAIHHFLAGHRKALVERCDQGKYFWELRSCIYWQEFERPKILWPDIAQRAEFAYDNEGNYLVNTLYLLPCTDKWLLSILNSATIWWFYSRISNQIRGGFVRYIAQYVSQIPISSATLGQQAELTALVDRILAAKAADPPAAVASLEAEIDHLVYGLYGLTEAEIAIVEGRDAAARPTKPAARPAKPSAGRQPRKSVMTEDPDLE